ncbi:hypothetical protein [Phytomonospora endophytica]|uniref:Uncharacterized protein n=1 Tax=Phytomonospora endophytica TaxID=714109 RepID=A0A841FCF6_9ACTN|nr:hypothetical protein [Phytomonospora endophytica]MBB6033474.1 hypothetical protein [Phytomonospora endophytica]GIG65007.1 hypothetical protein Pen01_13020 [Phytomonospora endophytica]
MLAEFRLARIVDGLPHRAEVAVEVRPAARDAVRIGGDPCGWRREAHGPGAWIGGPADDGMVSSAEVAADTAAARALSEHTGPPHEVTVTAIRDSNVDTGRGHVRFAAVHATARALGFSPADTAAARLTAYVPAGGAGESY